MAYTRVHLELPAVTLAYGKLASQPENSCSIRGKGWLKLYDSWITPALWNDPVINGNISNACTGVIVTTIFHIDYA